MTVGPSLLLLFASVAAPAQKAGPEGDDALVARACSGCHAVPSPEVLPREAWKTVLYEMAGLVMGNVGAPRDAPAVTFDFDVERLVRYYEARAPRALPAAEPWPARGGPLRFARHPMQPTGSKSRRPEATIQTVAHVRFFDLAGRGRLQVVTADMASGVVASGDPARPGDGLTPLATLGNPCHLEAVDLDRDGRTDLLAADLGDYAPEDHEKGSVVWLQQAGDGTFRTRVLAKGLPRVADVEASDVDGDGDLDLVVAAFGWRTVGGLYLLENRTKTWAAPVFERREIDPRAGAIHTPIADLDGDGRPDFVGLLAQHYESVEAFLGDGRGGFRPQPLFKGPHPSWGSSGLQLVDFDQDGDLDVLVTNGDMLDDFVVKPYHGIRWLENKGSLRFEEHFLATLPGVHRAQAADLDGDGDLDVVAGALVQVKGLDGPRTPPDQPSLVWLEQESPGRFRRHTLATGSGHVSLDVADYDRDGRLDLAVGHCRTIGSPAVELWQNLGKQP
jgi:hypothetical protein